MENGSKKSRCEGKEPCQYAITQVDQVRNDEDWTEIVIIWMERRNRIESFSKQSTDELGDQRDEQERKFLR